MVQCDLNVSTELWCVWLPQQLNWQRPHQLVNINHAKAYLLWHIHLWPPRQNPHCPQLQQVSSCVHVMGVGNGSLNVDDADKGYTGGPKERQWLVLWLSTSNPVVSCRPGTWVCISSWLLAKDSDVRGKPLQLGRTYHRRRKFWKMKTAGKATGNHPGKYVIHETVSMHCSCNILWCRHTIMAPHLEYHPWTWHVKNVMNLLVTAEH